MIVTQRKRQQKVYLCTSQENDDHGKLTYLILPVDAFCSQISHVVYTKRKVVATPPLNSIANMRHAELSRIHLCLIVTKRDKAR